MKKGPSVSHEDEISRKGASGTRYKTKFGDELELGRQADHQNAYLTDLLFKERVGEQMISDNQMRMRI